MCVLLGLVLLRISHLGGGVWGQGFNLCFFTRPFPPLLFYPPMFTISGVENIKIVFGREAKSLKNGTPTFLGVQYQSVSLGRPHKQTNKQ